MNTFGCIKHEQLFTTQLLSHQIISEFIYDTVTISSDYMSSYIRHSYYLIRLYEQLYTSQLLYHQIIWAIIYDTSTISSDYMSNYIRHSYYLIRLYEQLYTTQLLSHQSIGNSYNKHRQHQYYVFCIQKSQVKLFVLYV